MKKWRWVITAIVVVLVAGLGYYYFVRRASAAQTKQSQYQTTTVQRGNLVVTVSAAGTIGAQRQNDLVFGASGQVTEVKVRAGEVVIAGQLLMALDPTDLQASVAKAKLGLATARDQLQKLQVPPTQAALAAAQASVASAEANLAKVKAGPTQSDLASAQSALVSAQAALQQLLNGPTADDIQQAQFTLDQAKNTLWGAQGARDATNGNPNSSGASKAQAEAQVANGETGVQIAQLALKKLQEPPTAADVASARAKVAQAQAALDTLKQSPTAADIATAQLQLAQAQSALASLTAGPTDTDVAIAQAQVDQADIALQQAQRQLAAASLYAPYGGTLLAVNVQPGDWVAATEVVAAIADLSKLNAQGPLSEIDVAGVKPGQAATVQVNAFPNLTLAARVDSVAPSATVAQGVANYPTTVVLSDTNPSLYLGMSGFVTITTERRQNVLIMPNRAVRTQGTSHLAALLNNGALEWVPIKVGASNANMTEVTQGLQEGQTVVLDPPTPTAQTQQRGGGGAFIPGAGIPGLR